MTEPVREEERVDVAVHEVVGVAAQDAEIDQALGDLVRRGEVEVFVFDARPTLAMAVSWTSSTS